jgi:molybdopterin adenylyltransferase
MGLRVGILTVSDRSSRGERPDTSGPTLVAMIEKQGWQVARTDVQPDEMLALRQTLIDWADSGELDLILTTPGARLG